MHGRDGAPDLALVAGLTPDGRRVWGSTRKPDSLAALIAEDLCGEAVHVDGDGSVEFS